MSRMTTIIDAATGDQWRVPTRAVPPSSLPLGRFDRPMAEHG